MLVAPHISALIMPMAELVDSIPLQLPVLSMQAGQAALLAVLD
jgi:hypothetical protein